MNPAMFIPVATQLVESLVEAGILAAAQRQQAIAVQVARMHTIKWPGLAADYAAARDALLGAEHTPAPDSPPLVRPGTPLDLDDADVEDDVDPAGRQ